MAATRPSTVPGAKLGSLALDAIHRTSCIAGMAALPDHSIDVAIADPPYNASFGGKWRWDNSVALPGLGGDWQKVSEAWDTMDLPAYVRFTIAWLEQLKRVVKPTGSLWIHGTYHNIGIINFALQALGIEIINEVVWYKRNSFPNLAGRRLTASHETILWAHTGKRRQYFFDYAASKTLPCPEDSLRAPGKQMRTVWDIPNNKEPSELGHGKHPTQKPLRLLMRMLQLSARPGATCLAPFSGSGSECVAAARLHMRYLGFETNAAYVRLAQSRLAEEARTRPPRPRLSAAPPEPRSGETPAIPSLLKWTGSKRGQATRIFELFPSYRRYFEPFLGGGALLYLAARPGSVAGDLYAPLIALWKLVQTAPRSLAENYRAQWQKLQARLPEYFYETRARYNRRPNPFDLNLLMRTCVNGIVRFNDQGEFNNSFHLSRPGMQPERFAAVVRTWHQRLAGVDLRCGDYAETLADAKRGDVVYLDPPYAGSRHRYVANLDVDRLFSVLERLSTRGVRWLLSFDGARGSADLSHPVPAELYTQRVLIPNGHSAVGKVLNGPVEAVRESLYLNF